MAADCQLVHRQKMKKSEEFNSSGILNINSGSQTHTHARDNQTWKLLQ